MERAKSTGIYTVDSLDIEGFIHRSTPRQVIRVANALFRGRHGLVLFCIDPEKVRAEISFERAESRERYPHIYGPLNLDAVDKFLKFEPGPDEFFELPRELSA